MNVNSFHFHSWPWILIGCLPYIFLLYCNYWQYDLNNETVSLGVIAISLHVLQLQGEGGYSVVVKTQSAKICLNFNLGEGGRYSCQVKTQTAKIWPTFHFQGWGEYSWPGKNTLFLLKWAKILPCQPHSGRPCIKDSLSHTTYVETNHQYSLTYSQNNSYLSNFYWFQHKY